MRLEDINFLPPDTTTESFPASNTAASAVRVAKPKYRHYVKGITISCNGEPLNDITVEITSGAVSLDKFYIPAAAFAPIVHNYTPPLKGELGADVTLTVSSAGSAISVGAALRTLSGSP